MDWRSIKNNPPEMEQTVYTTDGKGMWVGQIIRGYEEPLLAGLCLENGNAVCIPLRTFTDWKPAQAAFQKQKSADEMFADLGYSGTPSGCYDRNDGMKSIEFYGDTSEPDSFVVIDHAGKYEVTATYDEILAIAQKIKEMEAEDYEDCI